MHSIESFCDSFFDQECKTSLYSNPEFVSGKTIQPHENKMNLVKKFQSVFALLTKTQENLLAILGHEIASSKKFHFCLGFLPKLNSSKWAFFKGLFFSLRDESSLKTD